MIDGAPGARFLQAIGGEAVGAGGALNQNPIPIVVPCHRVVGSNGSLVGYAGGLEVKRRLLALEGADLARRH